MKPITIVGGGLAGLALGLGLRRQSIPVTVMEAGHYPRHRVCGEFISGRGRTALEELGLEHRLRGVATREAATAAFYSRRVKGIPRALPQRALCVSRHLLDHTLADEFVRNGGTLCQGRRWNDGFGEAVVRATGRRITASLQGWRWFGLKIHARRVQLEADLELHLTPHGYVGLCQLDGGVVNICGLFRSRQTVPDLAETWAQWLTGPRDTTLHRRLADAEFLSDSFCSVAGLPPVAEKPRDDSECRVGDAVTMIPPLTGNGMSMAFESAELVRPFLAAYSRGEMNWTETRQAAQQACEGQFRRRLRCALWLQNLFFKNGAADAVVWLGTRSGVIWRTLFARTR